MDEMIKDSLEGFDTLWQRVTGRDAAQAEPDAVPDKRTYSQEDTLLGLIHDETCAALGASSLARMLQGDGRAVFLRHAADAKRHLRRLRAEYFITTGVTGGSNEDCRNTAGKLAAMRALFLQAEELAGRYEKAAEMADSAQLREVYLAFAEDVHRRAQETRSLLIESF